MSYVAIDHFFTVLGNKQRVKILQLLAKNGPLSVSSITAKLRAEQSAVSHCLSQLLACHFVSVERAGKERIYTINEETVHPVFNLIEKHVEKNCVKGCRHW